MSLAGALSSCIRWGGWVSLLVLMALAPGAMAAEADEANSTAASAATRPALSAPANSWESTQLTRPQRNEGNRGEATKLPSPSYSLWRLGGSLVLVLGVIFAVRWLARRFLGVPLARNASGVIQVLSRTVLSPKQQLMLIQVGRRVVLVADCGSQMNALCEITDPEEIAELAGQVQQRKNDSATNSFLSLMGRASTQFDGAGDQAQGSADGSSSPQGADPALNNMQEELGGLVEKVRVLSRQFKQS